jgi:hypothetical protein
LPKKHKILINYILELENKSYKEVYPNQTTIGKVIGCGRQRANEIVGELQELGLLTTNYRHMDSCLYKTTSFLRSPFMAQKLGHIFPSLRKLLLLLVIPFCSGGIKTEATQLDLKYLKVNGIREHVKNMAQNVGKYFALPQCLSRTPLTIEQKCSLAAYPEWMLDEEMFRITDMSRIRCLASYLHSRCLPRCVNPDWIFSSKLKDVYQNESDYNKMPTLLNVNEREESLLYQKETTRPFKGKYPQRDKTSTKPSVRRSQIRTNPVNPQIQSNVDRLYTKQELRIALAEFEAMPDKFLGGIGAKMLLRKQMELQEKLTTEEYSVWSSLEDGF